MDKTNQTEVKRFAVLIAALATCKGRECDQAMLKGYKLGLDDLPIAVIEMAVQKALREPNCRLPSPGELRELAGETRPADRAVMAFQALKTACSRVGGFRSPDFDDPLINAVVRNLGGWTRACEMPVSEFDTWYRKDFCAVYEMFCRTGTNGDQAAPLIGESEAANRENGFLEEVPGCRVPVLTGLPWAGEAKRLAGPDAKPILTLEGPR